MNTELFEPNEEELNQMIKELEFQMDECESQAEFNELKYQLDELLQRQRQLIIQNNAL